MSSTHARTNAFGVAIILLLGVAASVARAEWVPVGPPGGHVRALAADPRHPGRVYLGTPEGILYRSDDAGARWRRMTPGFPRRACSLDEIAVDRRGVVYVGYWELRGQGGGVARSTDGGKSFTVLPGIEGQSVRALALAPSDPEIVAAGTLEGVFLSRDAGRHWDRITPEGHADLRNVGSVTFDPQDPEFIMVGTWHLPWRTRDGGASWEPIHRGMLDDSDVMTLTFDRDVPRTTWATACSGIYRLSSDGTAWWKVEGIPDTSRRTRAFVQSRDELDVFLAGTTEGLWVTQDRGDSWRLATRQDLVVNALVALDDGTLLAGTEGAGVLRSVDRGWTWAPSNTGFSERFVSSVVFDPASRRVLVGVWGTPRDGGVFEADLQGGAWTRLAEGLEGRQVLALTLLDGMPVAGTDDGIFKRAPGAASWTRLDTRLAGRELRPRVTDLIAAPPSRLIAGTSNGVLLSVDGGRSWSQPSVGGGAEVLALAASPLDPKVVVAATKSGFFRSADRGVTWEHVSTALEGARPHAMVFLPDDALLATTSRGLYRSDDRGARWRRVDGGIPQSDLTGLAAHPDGRTIWASDFTHGGIFRSADAGRTWARMPTDGLGSDRVWALAVDPSSPQWVFASSSAGGLHVLQDGARITGDRAPDLSRDDRSPLPDRAGSPGLLRRRSR